MRCLVIVHDADLKQGDGLLGRDFLDNFTMTINSKKRVVTLEPKQLGTEGFSSRPALSSGPSSNAGGCTCGRTSGPS